MANHLLWTTTLIQAFYDAGVRHTIISPGSRSTPLTIAAAIHPGVEKKVVLDERSAAFIALGIGKSTGTPALLICTSGTAAANYYPALIEARESGVPIIVLSADRPPSLRGIGSSQTIDQIKLFGEIPLFFHEAGEPKTDLKSLKRLKYAAKQAVQESINSGGPAHINLPFDKPLEPSKQDFEDASGLISQESSFNDIQREYSKRSIELNDDLKNLISNSKKPLLIAGPSNPHHSLKNHIREILVHLNAPVIAETGSGVGDEHRILKRYEQYLRDSEHRNRLKPDLILRFGDQPFTKSVLTVLELWSDIPVIHFSARKSWQDHAMSVDYSVHLQKNDTLLLSGIEKLSDSGWLDLWIHADSQADSVQRSILAKEENFTDAHLFSHLGRQIGKSWNVMLSNSLPVRDMAMFGQPAEKLFVNRGAAGIDGIMSTALGIQFSNNSPTCVVAGDLAFLHDSNALYSLKYSKTPFIIIVVNNGGGNIFRMLPIHKQHQENPVSSELYTTFFETPQNTKVQFLAKASGINYHSITSLRELEELQLNQYKHSTIVECVTNSGAGMKLRQKLWDG